MLQSWRKTFKQITIKNILLILAGSLILAFGIRHVHSISQVTEGGGLGLILLLEYWFHISPSVTSIIFNGICYWIGWRTLGKEFLVYSAFATGGFSLFYWIFESFPPLWPGLAEAPLWAALIGALFVGVGAGLCVRAGGAAGGDDALAMSISEKLHIKIEWVYLASDVVVLALSLTYIPLRRIAYSLLTVVLSGQILGWVQRVKFRKKEKEQISE